MAGEQDTNVAIIALAVHPTDPFTIFASRPDAELQHGNAHQLCHDEVTEFVKENEGNENNDKRNNFAHTTFNALLTAIWGVLNAPVTS